MTEFLSKFSFKDGEYSYFNLEEAVSHYGGDIKKIPYTIRILLESLLRKYDGVDVIKNHIENLATYNPKKTGGEVPFKPSRVILQDFTGVPVVVDLASMRDAIVAQVGGIGISPGANINYLTGHAIFEATHGTAPDIAGKDIANPCSVLLSGCMLFDYIGWTEVTSLITAAIEKTFAQGQFTADLAQGKVAYSTSEFAAKLIENL